ncbi:head-tail connector protein [Clostridium sp.]|jgi:uncharacterized phage protein (predicted DNA packaging)|uniref:head-tail connector protein n=1 Tax=Clostridium sp. TaxID=1506 RepID=UPI003EEBF307
MKISEVTTETASEYLRLDFEEPLLPIMLIGAKSYIKAYTGIKEDVDLDSKEDLTLAYLALVSDMYDNRSATVEKDKVNKIVDTILNMYCVNLL